jgi:hypothetical protein
MTDPARYLTELDDTTEAYIGAVLFVEPIPGWGWHYGINTPTGLVPAVFHSRLLRPWPDPDSGLRRGGIARIEEPDHQFDGRFLSFESRLVGSYNFMDRLGRYNASITDTDPGAIRLGFPLGPSDPSIHMSGYVIIADPSIPRGRSLLDRMFDP